MRLGAVLFLMGLPGIVLLGILIIPALLRFAPQKPTIPLPLIVLITIAQSAVLLALALWAGGVLGSRVGLHAPLVSGLVTRTPPTGGFTLPLATGLATGLVGGVLLFFTTKFAPTALADIQAKLALPLPFRLLYGGITEELLTRWGLMCLLLWFGWRFIQGADGAPELRYVLGAIFVSAILFGILHLPIAAALSEKMTRPLIVYVVGVNAIFGVAFGYLFWRNGLEAAMVAHASTHLFSWAGESLLTATEREGSA